MKVRWLAGLAVVVCSAGAVAAQEKISLEDAVARALKQNFDVRIVRLGADSAAVTNRYAFGAFLPSVNAQGSVSGSNTDSKAIQFNDSTRVASGATSDNLAGAIQLNWTIFDGTRMFATRQRVKQLAELGVIRVQNQMMNSVASVTSNYYNIVRQKQQLKAVMELMAVNEERVKLAEKKLQVGIGAKPELLQAKVDLNTQRTVAIQQETLIQQLKDQLNGLLGMTLPEQYDVSDTIPINLSITREEILANIENTNQTLAVAKQNIAVAKTQVWEAKAARSPVISLNSSYQYSRTNNYLQTSPFNLKYNQGNGLYYGVLVTFPIFNAFNATRLIDLAQIREQRAQLVYNQQLTTATVAVRNAYVAYENAKRTLQISEDNIGVAKENVNIALETFRRGVSTFIELRTAQQTTVDAYNQLIVARYNAKVAEIELLRLKGALLTPGVEK